MKIAKQGWIAKLGLALLAPLFTAWTASAQISITLDEPLTRTYDGTPQTVTATTVPPGLANVVTYDGGMDLPTDAGEYDVVATIVEPGYPNLEAEGTLTINPKPLNVAGVTASDKRYDGTTDAVIDTSAAALVGVVAPDIVDLDASAATGAFEDKDFGLTKNVLVTGFSLTGDDVANYVLADPAMDSAPTARITRRLISVSGLAPVDRFYDGSVNVDLEGEPVGTLFGEPETPAFIEGDDIAFTGTRTGTMADKSAGSDKAVAPVAPLVGGEGFSGADANNYRIWEIQPVENVDIWKVPVTVAGLSANKMFDDTLDAPIDTVAAAVVGIVPGDDVTVVDPVNMGTFADKNYGNNIPVTPDPVLLAAMTLGGADAGNYEIDFAGEFGGLTAALFGNIGSAVVDIYPDAGQTKIFGQEDPVFTFTTDPAAAQASLVGNLQRVPGEDVGLYNFDITDLSDPNLNYVPQLIGAEQFEITPLDVTIVPDPGQSKTYQEDDPVFTYTSTPDIAIGLDPFTGALARDPGEAAGLYAYTMGTLDAGPNYTLALADETFEILPLDICVQGLAVVDKIYNGLLNATIDWTAATLGPVDVIGADDVAVDVGASVVTGAFQDKAVGTDKPVEVDVSGIVLTGADAVNYTVAGICSPVTGNITPKGLHVAGLAVVDKTYDGNTDAEIDDAARGLFGVVAGDAVALNGSVVAGQFADPSVGTWDVLPDLGGLSLSGGDAVNYLLLTDWIVNPPPVGLEGDITAKELTVAGALAEDKVYDGNADATVDFSAASLEGVVDPDDVTLDIGAYTAAFNDKNVGEDKPVAVDGLALAGAQAGNYSLEQPTLAADVDPAELLVGGAFVADDKVYDGNVEATGDTTGLTLLTPVLGDDVQLLPVLAFADPNVGIDILVSLTDASSLTGDDAGNYTLALTGAPTDTADITPLALTVDGITVNDKVYNMGAAAVLNFDGAALVGVLGEDDVMLDTAGYTATFAGVAVGTWDVTVAGLGLAGAQAGNYTLTQPVLSGNIVPAPQTINFPAIGDQGILDTPALLADATSGLPVTFSVVSGPAYIDGGLLYFTAGGEVTVMAKQGGGGNWAKAPDVEQTFAVDPSLTETIAASQEWTVPDGVYEVNVQAWGGGGAGGGSENPDPMAFRGGAGGGGGAYAGSTLAVEPGQVLNLVVASATIGVQGENGPDGGATYIGADEASAILLAVGGKGGQGNTAGGTPIGGAGGLEEDCIGDTKSSGADGGNGATGIGESSGAGGNAAEYGVLLSDPEGAGGASRDDQGRGNEGVLPGGGGGGSWSVDASRRGGDGAAGRIVLAYTIDDREPSTTVANDAAAVYGDAQVELTALVNDDGTVQGDTVIFVVSTDGGDVDSDPAPVSNGAASVLFDLAGLPAGDYPVTAWYTGNVDFQPSVSEEATLTIAVADPVVDAWPTASDLVYGQTLADSVLSDGVASVPGVFAFDAPVTVPNAGTAAQAVTFTPDDAANYNTVAGTVDVLVNKADPIVNAWPVPGTIIFGNTLADSTLTGGEASVPGTFAFDDPALAPGAGTAAQAVTFTADDAANYNAVAGTVDVQVNPADSLVTVWPSASAITFGDTLADSALTGGEAGAPGTFAFDDPALAPNAGAAAQAVTFTPADLVNYNPAVGTVAVLVNKADPVVNAWPTASALTFGQTLADSVLSGGAASVPGTFAFDAPATVPNAGTAAQAVTFTPDDAANYNTVAGTVDVTVNKANPTVDAWPTASAIVFGQTLADSVLSGGAASVPGTFAFDAPATAPGAGTAAQAVTFTPDDAANYNTVAGTVDVTVNVADATVETWPTASALTYGQTLADSVLSGGAASVPGTFAFDAPATVPNAGTAAQAVTFTPDDAANYNAVAGTVDVTVNVADAVVTTPPLATDLVYNQSLAESWLVDGVASVPGTFAWADDSIIPLPGVSQQTVVFTPADAANYNGAQFDVDVTVFNVAAYDFDGDGSANLATYKGVGGQWNVLGVGLKNWGSQSMVPVPADFDGDSITDYALYQPTTGNWFILYSSGGSRTVKFGENSAMIPLPGDYDNDGKADLALFYPAQSRWYFFGSTEGYSTVQFGGKADVPVPADYDGDGVVDVAVYRPSNGNWYIIFSGGGSRVTQLGWNGTVPVPADYDGDGKADVAVLSRATSKWCISYSGGGSLIQEFGYKTMTPVAADYDGDGSTDIAMYHQASGNWYVRQSSDGQQLKIAHGGAGQIPVLLYPLIHFWFGMP